MFKELNLDISEQIATCQRLGEQAAIEPFIERCRYVGFIIQVPNGELERYKKSDEAISNFKQVIDRRIDDQDFTDLYIHPASSELDPYGVPRVVFDPKGRVLVTW